MGTRRKGRALRTRGIGPASKTPQGGTVDIPPAAMKNPGLGYPNAYRSNRVILVQTGVTVALDQSKKGSGHDHLKSHRE
jgi:hypothetical protein